MTVPVISEKLPASNRHRLRRPGRGPVSRLSVALEALAPERMASVSRSCASSMAVSGMRTRKMGLASVTSAAIAS